MSTDTLTPNPQRTVALFSAADSTLGYGKLPEHKWIKGPNDNDILVLLRQPVFRSGEFADSMGREHLWEDMHIQTMASNFNLLKESNVFSDVPIRVDHPGFMGGAVMGSVIGYHENLVTEKMVSPADGVEYTYLLADLHIIKAEAQQDILNGLFRNRSAEIGPYYSNNKAEYWPTYQGVAYVDIPAVEGLKQYSKGPGTSKDTFSILMEEKMTGTTVDPNKITPAVQPSAAPFSFSLPGVSGGIATTTDFSKVQELLNTQFGKINELTTELASRDTRIATLEAFEKETREEGRVAFAKGLIAEGKLLASDEEATIEFCKELTPEAFESYSKLMGNAPVNPVLGNYGSPNPTYSAPGSTQRSENDVKADKLEILRGQVQMHQRSGKTQEQIKQFKSYKELVELDPTAAFK